MTQTYIHIENNCSSVACPTDEDPPSWVSACIDHPSVAQALGQRIPAFSILYADKDEAKELNSEYRNKDYATNVLSFPAELPDFITSLDDGFTLGDLVICPDVVIQQAQEQSKQVNHHYAHLTIHGFLHLLGFDHIQDAEAEEMEAIEIAILKSLGIPNPYEDTNLSVAALDEQQEISNNQPETV
ncbi:MAG: rRNA maturation RNase YbeY [Gammaproteobacteria bacterium]|nr:rRNA maturation RNase YbeY [Gammaproteobacteria bacterium]HBF07439.1 rRNA maturation RNase YbeY [Gammaproteobacteria bacterium]|tara:strand:- start:3854 stop:4408 length:555 start_codon:yes stop_codon:yes gene_type:complete